MSQFVAQTNFSPWKAGDRILVEAIVESVFDGVSNWPVKILLDRGNSETIDAAHNVHYSAIHPISALSDSHAELVKALEDIRGGKFDGADTLAVSGSWKLIVERLQKIAADALATLTARKVG